MIDTEILQTTANFIVLATTTALLFVIMNMPRRSVVNRTFLGLCILLIFHALSSQFLLLQEPDELMLEILLNGDRSLLLVFVGLYILSRWQMQEEHQFDHQILAGSVALFVLGLGMIWGSEWLPIESSMTRSNSFISVGLIYSLGAFAMLWQAGERSGAVSVLIVGLGFASGAVLSLSFAAVVFVLGIFLAAHEVTQQQFHTPLDTMSTELVVASVELQKATNQLSRHKERSTQLVKELADAHRYKTEFLAMISHELRTPLNSIIGYSELLGSPIFGELNEHQKDRVNRIHRNGVHLSDLINSILDLVKIDSGRLNLKIRPFPLQDAVSNIVNKLAPVAEEKGLQLNTEIPDTLPLIEGDQKRIEQILYNVLDNAIKFTEMGSISLSAVVFTISGGAADTISLPTSIHLDDGGWCLVSIQDTGMGIDRQDHEQIFDSFSQLDGSYTREYGGIGLGLTIARRLIELHHGVIWLDSMPGTGSTFYVAMPVVIG